MPQCNRHSRRPHNMVLQRCEKTQSGPCVSNSRDLLSVSLSLTVNQIEDSFSVVALLQSAAGEVRGFIDAPCAAIAGGLRIRAEGPRAIRLACRLMGGDDPVR